MKKRNAPQGQLMDKRRQYEVLVILTNNVSLIWKSAHGITLDSITGKLDEAMLEWQSELTKTLKIYELIKPYQ